MYIFCCIYKKNKKKNKDEISRSIYHAIMLYKNLFVIKQSLTLFHYSTPKELFWNNFSFLHFVYTHSNRLIWLVYIYVLASIRYVQNIHKYNQNKEWLWSTPRFICKLNSFMFCTYNLPMARGLSNETNCWRGKPLSNS